ncbi:hypothetical protein BGZ96_012233 [Linnemannia gamsii]|uniref:HMG box domain-containing protein n=1 Tax=Linnemannia gamsii TaxID=64522 RepID=A0ABQ7JSB8_9FUNG|nr:hypothetical protein BGZ96_012233 [Linnemannia gamsii]
MLYRSEQSANYPKMTAAELSKILGKKWFGEPPERRAYYTDLAKAAEKEHALKYPDYKFTPAKRGTGRRAKTIRAAVSASQKVTTDSTKARVYKPSPLSALAPAPASTSPQSTSSHLMMPSLHRFLGQGVSHSAGSFPYTTTAKNNSQASTQLVRPVEVEDYRLHHSKSFRSGAQRPKPRHAATPLRPRPTTSSMQSTSYYHAAPGPFDLEIFPSFNFGFPHILSKSQGVSNSSSMSSPGLSASSLLFDPVVPTNWQWTPPTPATPSQFSMSAMTPSSFQSQSQSPMPLSHEVVNPHANVPTFDYFALQDPSRPATFAMNWSHLGPPITEIPLPISGDGAAVATTTAARGDGEYATPASYQWGVGTAVPASAWSNLEAVYDLDLSTPVSPGFRASMNIPIPPAKQNNHNLHNYHNQMMPLSQNASGFTASMLVEQDMSVSPVLSSCSSSFSSMYSLSEQQQPQVHFPQSFLPDDLAIESVASKIGGTTMTMTSTSGYTNTTHVTLLELGHQKNLKLAAASQLASPSLVTYKTFV